MADEKSLTDLLEELLDETLEIGSDNWDSYLEGRRRPELEASPRYQELRRRLRKCESS
jgi:hypothetical protein